MSVRSMDGPTVCDESQPLEGAEMTEIEPDMLLGQAWRSLCLLFIL